MKVGDVSESIKRSSATISSKVTTSQPVKPIFHRQTKITTCCVMRVAVKESALVSEQDKAKSVRIGECIYFDK